MAVERGYVRLSAVATQQGYEYTKVRNSRSGSNAMLPQTNRIQLLEQLQQQDEDDIRWIIGSLLRSRPVLWRSIQEAHESILRHSKGWNQRYSCISDLEVVGEEKEESKEKVMTLVSSESMPSSKTLNSRLNSRNSCLSSLSLTRLQNMLRKDPVVQFSKVVFFASPEFHYAEIDVTRIGNLTGWSTVHYRTSDISSDSHKVYHALEGSLRFEPGNSFKSIQVQLVHLPEWNPPIDFQVELLQEGLEGATLSHDLCRTRVEVIDTSTFPSNRVSESTLQKELSGAAHGALALEFLRMLWSNSGIRAGIIKTILADALSNLHHWVRWSAQMYLADVLLNIHASESNLAFAHDRRLDLLCVAVIMVLPQFISHYVAYRKCFGLGANTRSLFFRGLYCVFLNSSMSRMEDLQDGDLIMSMGRDSLFVVDHLLYGWLDIIKHFGQIISLCAFQLFWPLLFHEMSHPVTLIPAIAFPVLQLIFLAMRESGTTRLINARDREYASFVDQFTDAIHNYHLVVAFKCRALFFKRFEKQAKSYNDARKNAKLCIVNNQEYSFWLSVLAVSLYVYWGGLRVVAGEFRLGAYLVNIHIYKALGEGYAEVYSDLLRMQSAIPALMRITHLLNQPLDLLSRQKVRHHQKVIALEKLSELHQETGDHDEPLIDKLLFQVGNLRLKANDDTYEWNFDGMLEVTQGHCVHLVGPHGEGKAMMLKIISGVVYPPVPNNPGEDTARLFIPPHLRVFHVSGVSGFFRAPLLENLLIGSPASKVEEELPRATKICKRLGLSERIVNYLLLGDCLAWDDILSNEETALLHLARGLTSNPEVLCFERHWMAFDERTAIAVDGLITDFVNGRGVEQDPDMKHSRRPRTCFITESGNRFHRRLPDDPIFHVSRKGGIQQVAYRDLEFEMPV